MNRCWVPKLRVAACLGRQAVHAELHCLLRIGLPITAFAPAVSAAFPADPQGKLNTLLPRLLYCAINGLGLAFAGYRINQMGLLPTHLSDWVSSIQAPQVRGCGALDVQRYGSRWFPEPGASQAWWLGRAAELRERFWLQVVLSAA